DACRKGTMLRNVADLADPPSHRRSGAMKAWTAAQLLQFLTEIESHWLATAFHLAANTGMRRGEVLGLAWGDVDLDAGRISVQKSSLPRIRLHDLRHTHATILLKAGIPVKVVSERLGHSSPAFTMAVYQHVLPGMQADAARAFGDAVFGPVEEDEPDDDE